MYGLINKIQLKHLEIKYLCPLNSLFKKTYIFGEEILNIYIRSMVSKSRMNYVMWKIIRTNYAEEFKDRLFWEMPKIVIDKGHKLKLGKG